MRVFLKKYFAFILLALTLIACAIGITIAYANGDHADIPPPKQKYNEETVCVEPIEIMRKEHFEFILEHRDDTVIDGIRTKKYSLNECIDCHITANAQGKFARYSEDTHFCASCHQYAAVNIDCFQCHADRPEEAIRKAMNPNQTVGLTNNPTDEEKVKNYLHISNVAPQ